MEHYHQQRTGVNKNMTQRREVITSQKRGRRRKQILGFNGRDGKNGDKDGREEGRARGKQLFLGMKAAVSPS